jgi:hypothetical protein
MSTASAVVGTARRTGEIRPFVEQDVPQVARLHQAIFTPAAPRGGRAGGSYHAYFTRVFLHSPWRNPALPSLVYQEPDGQVAGFLGVAPRRIVVDGRRFQAAISSQFVVERSTGAGLVAVRLAKAFFDGPQDLSISDEANDGTRRIWEGLGGTTSLVHSMHWVRPLKPARFVLSLVGRRRGCAAIAVMARPVAVIADAIATRSSFSPLYTEQPGGSLVDLTEQIFLEQFARFAGDRSLRVEYDDRSTHWLWERVRHRKPDGVLHASVLRHDHTILGWFMYHLGRDRVADVLQIAGTRSTIHDVLEHLFHDAARRGAVAASGRVEPRFLQALSDVHCVFHCRGPWVLVHAKQPELVRCFQGEKAFFSRLDGEWALGF